MNDIYLFNKIFWLFYIQTSNNNLLGSSMQFCKCFKNRAKNLRIQKLPASLPSISLWSYVSTMYIIGLATILSKRTTGLFTIACIPRIALYGILIIGVPIRLPNTPPFEIEKVPPYISPIVIFPFFPFSANSAKFFSISAKLFDSQFLNTGTIYKV